MIKIRDIFLILFNLYSLFFVMGSIASPIFAHFGFYNISAKLFFLYFGACHQQPHLSFWILGYPVALCCRCLGFYIGVFVSCLIYLCSKKTISCKVFVLLFVFSLIDLACNYLFEINTGKILRLFAGMSMGIILTECLDFTCKEIIKWRVTND